MSGPSIVFPRKDQTEFLKVLRKRVRSYFKENDLTIYSDYRMILKTIAMLSIYFTPYFLMVLGVVSNAWLIVFLWMVMGVGMSGIGLSIMHDANHGAYSKHKWVNKTIGYIINLVGGNATNWKIQHNILHHSYTNVHSHDEDISAGRVLRLCPHDERLPFHKYQHIYAWFLYTLMTLMWSTTKDYRQLFRFKKEDLLKTQSRSFKYRFVELLLSKIAYYSYILVVPLIFVKANWWVILIGYVLMHMIAGLLLACVFQPAHVVPDTSFPLPDKDGKMENHWAIHQLLTTTNFAPSSRFFSWFVGGLNFQIEHHLFPNICHIHYKQISKIVRETAREFKLPYYSQPSFIKALIQHKKMLYQLGNFS